MNINSHLSVIGYNMKTFISLLVLAMIGIPVHHYVFIREQLKYFLIDLN